MAFKQLKQSAWEANLINLMSASSHDLLTQKYFQS